MIDIDTHGPTDYEIDFYSFFERPNLSHFPGVVGYFTRVRSGWESWLFYFFKLTKKSQQS